MADRIKRGKYEIKVHPKGSFTIYFQGRKKGRYTPSPEVLRKICIDSLETCGKLSPYLKTSLGYMGLFKGEKRDVVLGKKILGIEGPFRKTKRGLIKNGVAVPLEEVQEAIRRVWPKEQVDYWRSGNNVDFSKVGYFRNKFKREYLSAHAIRGGLQKVFEKVYSPKDYPGLYNRVCKRAYNHNISTIRLGNWFRKRADKGLPISQGYLRHSQDSEENLAYRQMMRLVENPNEILKKSFDEILMEISGISKEDIETFRGTRTPMAKLSEELAYFFFTWADLTGVDLEAHTPKGQIYKVGHEIVFYGLGKDRKADLRIGNAAVEVKSGVGAFKSSQARETLERYSSNSGWKTGEPLEDIILFFHSQPRFYSEALPSLQKPNFKIIEYPWFRQKLEQVIVSAKDNYSRDVQNVVPRITNLSYILELDTELVINPYLLMRPANNQRREWSRDLLRNLADKARELKYGTK